MNDVWIPGAPISAVPEAVTYSSATDIGVRGAALNVVAQDFDSHMLFCESADATSTPATTVCGELSYSYNYFVVPFDPAGPQYPPVTFVGPSDSSAKLMLLPETAPAGVWAIVVTCDVVDVGPAVDPMGTAAWAFVVLSDPCSGQSLTLTGSSFSATANTGTVTPVFGQCCVTDRLWDPGPPITCYAPVHESWDATGSKTRVTLLGEALVINTNATDHDYLIRKCDDAMGTEKDPCPFPEGAVMELLMLEDTPLMTPSLVRTSGTGGTGQLVGNSGPISVGWIPPPEPGTFELCTLLQNRGCNAHDADNVPATYRLRALRFDMSTRVAGGSWLPILGLPADASEEQVAALADCQCVVVHPNTNDDDNDGVVDHADTSVTDDPTLAGLQLDTDDDIEIQFRWAASTNMVIYKDPHKANPIAAGTWFAASTLRFLTAKPRIYIDWPGSTPIGDQVLQVSFRTPLSGPDGAFNRTVLVVLRQVALTEIKFLAASATGLNDPTLGSALPWTGVSQAIWPEGFFTEQMPGVGTQPHDLSKGYYIEPDPVLPTDLPTGGLAPTWLHNHRNVVTVEAKVSPPRAGVVVRFASLDVDDNTHSVMHYQANVPDKDSTHGAVQALDEDNGGYYEQPFDTIALPYGGVWRRGFIMDNPDPVLGIEQPPADYVDAATDEQGRARAYLCVSTTPGDNYRVVATLYEDEIDNMFCPRPSHFNPRDLFAAAVAYEKTGQNPVKLPVETAVNGAVSLATGFLTVRKVLYLESDHVGACSSTNATSDNPSHDQWGFGIRRYMDHLDPVTLPGNAPKSEAWFPSTTETATNGDNRLKSYGEWPLPAERDESPHYGVNVAFNGNPTAIALTYGSLGSFQGGRMYRIAPNGALSATPWTVFANGDQSLLLDVTPGNPVQFPLAIPGGGVAQVDRILFNEPANQTTLRVVGSVVQTGWAGAAATLSDVPIQIAAVDVPNNTVQVNAQVRIPVYLCDNGVAMLTALGLPGITAPLPPDPSATTCSVQTPVGNVEVVPAFDYYFKNMPMRLQLIASASNMNHVASYHDPNSETAWLLQDMIPAESYAEFVSRPRSWLVRVVDRPDVEWAKDGDCVGEDTEPGSTNDAALAYARPRSANMRGWANSSGYCGIAIAHTPYDGVLANPAPFSEAGVSISSHYLMSRSRTLAHEVCHTLVPMVNLPAAGEHVMPGNGPYDLTDMHTIPGITSYTTRNDPGEGTMVNHSHAFNNGNKPACISPYIIWYTRHHLRCPGVYTR